MNIQIKKNNLHSGDRIVVPKSLFGVIQHHALYLGKNFQGIDLMIENVAGIGVQLITADNFFKNAGTITRIERFNGTGIERKAAVKRALNEIGKSYDVVNYNCESFSNYVQYNQVVSDQSNNFKLLAGLCIGYFLLSEILSNNN